MPACIPALLVNVYSVITASPILPKGFSVIPAVVLLSAASELVGFFSLQAIVNNNTVTKKNKIVFFILLYLGLTVIRVRAVFTLKMFFY